jgi:hypothetical protein
MNDSRSHRPHFTTSHVAGKRQVKRQADFKLNNLLTKQCFQTNKQTLFYGVLLGIPLNYETIQRNSNMFNSLCVQTNILTFVQLS